MGQESVREDFLAGRNGAALLGEEDLKYLDDLYSEVLPKHGREDGSPPFQVC
jgi:caprin-1